MTEEPDEAVKAVLSGAAQGPPLGIEVHDIIERGGRIRRRRKRLAVVGSSAATVVAVVAVTAVALGFGRSPVGPNPVEPAGPGLTTESVTPAPSTVPTPAVTNQRGVTPESRTTTVPTGKTPDQTTAQRPPLSTPSNAAPPRAGTTTAPIAPVSTSPK
jgi:hypothetical protein